MMASGSATAPSGPECIHEIKHDGYRLIARKDGERVRLWSRWAVLGLAALPRSPKPCDACQ